MFAVPGWSLPASAPVVQTDPTATKDPSKKKKKKEKTSGTGANDIPVVPRTRGPLTEEEIAARKEKEEREKKEHRERSVKGQKEAMLNAVKPENVVEMFERVIEGKKKEEVKEGEGRRKRKRKAKAEGDEGKDEGGKKMKVEGDKGERKEKLKKEKKTKAPKPAAEEEEEEVPALPTVQTPLASLPALTPLQAKMRAKLSSARFRHINETLYTTPSAKSLDLFHKDPSMYFEYHTGFRQQVTTWPENPVDVFISQLRARSNVGFQKGHSKKHLPSSTALLPLPRDRDSGVCTVADLGCGDAKIAATFNHGKEGKNAKITVKSFDLQASTPDVTVADVANLPIPAESVDVAIFCLALMGTNFLDFVDEAFRILRWRGELWVAEIKSRFNRKVDTTIKVGTAKKKKAEGEEEEVDPELADLADGATASKKEELVYKSFVDALEKRGFKLRGQVDAKNKMFVRMEFVKMPERERKMMEEEEDEASGKNKGMGVKGRNLKEKRGKTKFLENDEPKEGDILKPCVYKLR